MEEITNTKNDKKILISESQIKCILNEHDNNIVRWDFLFSLLGITLSLFFGAFAIPAIDIKTSVLRILFFVLSGVAFIGTLIVLIIQLIRFKKGKGSTKWFIDEVFNSHEIIEKKKTNRDLVLKRRMRLVSALVAFLPPTLILILILGLNNWSFMWVINTPDQLGILGIVGYIAGTILWIIFSPLASVFVLEFILHYDLD